MKLKFTLEVVLDETDGYSESQAADMMIDAINESFPSCAEDENGDPAFFVESWGVNQA